MIALIKSAMDERKGVQGYLIDGFPKVLEELYNFEEMVSI